jgi:chemotaxis protein methyltransferase CheR
VSSIRTLAGADLVRAEQLCADAVATHSLCVDLHYLHAVLLTHLDRIDDAIGALKHVIYLDRTLAAAHFMLGMLLARQGDRAGARRAYRNALELCAARPADEVLPLSEGERAGQLAEVAAFQLTLLDDRTTSHAEEHSP